MQSKKLSRLIHFSHRLDLLDNRSNEEIRFQHFHVRAVFEDVHQQFAVVVEGDFQFETAVVQPAGLLLGMPVFIGDPARAFGGKNQHGGVFAGPEKMP